MEKVEAELTWVEEDDGSQTAKLRLIHLHIFHFGYQLCQDSARDRRKTRDDKNKTRLHKEEGVADGCNHVKYIFKDNKDSNIVLRLNATYLSKMEPTPALWALLLWTWRPVANRMPSFTVTERCENEAIRSSFQPECKKEKKTVTSPSFHSFLKVLLKFV